MAIKTIQMLNQWLNNPIIKMTNIGYIIETLGYVIETLGNTKETLK